jgi:hypothetical protein
MAEDVRREVMGEGVGEAAQRGHNVRDGSRRSESGMDEGWRRDTGRTSAYDALRHISEGSGRRQRAKF